MVCRLWCRLDEAQFRNTDQRMNKNTGPLRDVVRRELIENHAQFGLVIRDHLGCGHTFERPVSNSGNYATYNPAARRRCETCPA